MSDQYINLSSMSSPYVDLLMKEFEAEWGNISEFKLTREKKKKLKALIVRENEETLKRIYGMIKKFGIREIFAYIEERENGQRNE